MTCSGVLGLRLGSCVGFVSQRKLVRLRLTPSRTVASYSKSSVVDRLREVGVWTNKLLVVLCVWGSFRGLMGMWGRCRSLWLSLSIRLRGF